MKDYADQQKRLLADIANYMQRNRVLARQREEDEIAQEIDCNSSASPSMTAAEPNIKDESIPVMETMPQSNDMEMKPQDEVDATSEKKEEEVESVEERMELENSPRHRMNLTLELKTRCQMLESPDFVPESEMQAVSPPPVEAITDGTPLAVRNKRKIIMDMPPSPMVSSQGRTVLVPVFEDPLSPSLDDMMPLTGKTRPTKSYDVMSGLDTSCELSQVVNNCQASTPKSDELASVPCDPNEFTALSPNSAESSSMPSSPDGSFSSASNQEDSSFTLRPVLARSASLPADVPPGRSSQHRKSSLKATRPKHRFQVSKTILPHKPPLGRRGSGSHKTPPGVVADTPRHGKSEHSTVESVSSPFLMVMPLTTFQLKTATDNCSREDNASLKISEASCNNVNASALLPAASSAIEPSLLLTDLPVPPVDGQTTSEIDSLQATSIAPNFPLNDVSATPERSVLPNLSANGVLPNSIQVTSVDSETAAESESLTLCGDPGNTSVDDSSTEDKNIDVEATDDCAAEHRLDLVETSGTSDDGEISEESAPNEENKEIPGVNVQNSTSQSSVTGNTDIETCKRNHGEANSIADVRDQHEMDDVSSSDKTSRVSNGLKVGFPQDVIDMADLADDVRKLHLENTASSSGTSNRK